MSAGQEGKKGGRKVKRAKKCQSGRHKGSFTHMKVEKCYLSKRQASIGCEANVDRLTDPIELERGEEVNGREEGMG
jgi:hypothetical protein